MVGFMALPQDGLEVHGRMQVALALYWSHVPGGIREGGGMVVVIGATCLALHWGAVWGFGHGIREGVGMVMVMEGLY